MAVELLLFAVVRRWEHSDIRWVVCSLFVATSHYSLTHSLTHTHTHTHVAIMSDTHAGALHILKKHEGSRRPSSWRTEAITQSKEEAIAQIGM